jgi:16S rRNA (adenine1518-N6/adenine1519-N6)-dimethyltransferase
VPARLGQHFLVDPSARDAIVRAASVSGKSVLEIGPGKGFLTEGLVEAGAKVTAVEMDEALAAGLAQKWPTELRLVRADFLKLDLSDLGEGPFTIVANLPYSVASPILQKLLSWPRWSLAVLMFQKEVAERITAAPGGPDYGLLTLSVLARAEAQYLLDVPRESFAPRPKIASAVIGLRRREVPLVAPEKEKAFFRIARAAFGQRRKMAANPLAQAVGLPREKVVEALARCGVEAGARAENIPLAAYIRLTSELGL